MNVKLSLTEREAQELSKLLNFLLESSDTAEESLMSVCNKTDDAIKNSRTSEWTRVDSIDELPKDTLLLIEYKDEWGIISHIAGWYEKDDDTGDFVIKIEYTDEAVDINPIAYIKIPSSD